MGVGLEIVLNFSIFCLISMRLNLLASPVEPCQRTPASTQRSSILCLVFKEGFRFPLSFGSTLAKGKFSVPKKPDGMRVISLRILSKSKGYFIASYLSADTRSQQMRIPFPKASTSFGAVVRTMRSGNEKPIPIRMSFLRFLPSTRLYFYLESEPSVEDPERSSMHTMAERVWR